MDRRISPFYYIGKQGSTNHQIGPYFEIETQGSMDQYFTKMKIILDIGTRVVEKCCWKNEKFESFKIGKFDMKLERMKLES